MSAFDDLIANAEERRLLLTDEVDRLDAWIIKARELKMAGVACSEALAAFGGEGKPAASPRGVRPTEMVAAAETALRAAARPLSRGQLFEALRAAGVEIGGEDPVKNLGTVLWRSGRFDNTGRVYWFKGEPRPDRA